jgi:hypothetical protein
MRIFILAVLLIGATFSRAQNNRLEIKGIEELKINYQNIVKDSNESIIISKTVLRELFKLGYLTASIDSSFFPKGSHSVYISANQQIEWAKLGIGNITE